jgi:hypothetical protein
VAGAAGASRTTHLARWLQRVGVFAYDEGVGRTLPVLQKWNPGFAAFRSEPALLGELEIGVLSGPVAEAHK